MIEPSLLVAVTGFTNYLEGEPKYLTVADMERAARIPKKIATAVNRYVTGDKWTALGLEKVEFAWKKLSTAIENYDPDDIVSMEKMVGGLPDSEELAGGYVGAMQRVVQYVSDQMPQTSTPAITGIVKHEPGVVSLHRWNRCVTIAEEPLCVLEWLHGGCLTTAAVDCLTAMYPPILEMMTSAAVIALGNAQLNSAWRLPRNKQVQLSLLLGSFTAPGLQQAIQAIVDEGAQKLDREGAVSAAKHDASVPKATTKET